MGIFTSWGSEIDGSYKTPISLTGLIEPSETLQVQSSVGGRVENINVKVNQTITEDQLLLTLENTSQKRQLELSQIQLKINENNVKVSENSIKDMETNLKDIKRRLMMKKPCLNKVLQLVLSLNLYSSSIIGQYFL